MQPSTHGPTRWGENILAWGRALTSVRGLGRSRLGRWVAPLFLVVSLAGPVDAAVRFDLFVGYDGVVPQGSWFPMGFEVQNDGPAFTALVEVAPGQFNSSQTRTMTVELPTGTTKRFVIPTFAGVTYNPTWNARLLDERGRVRAETTTQRLRRFNESALPLAGALSRAMPPLPELKARQEELRPVFARLQAAVFPDNPLSLEGLDTIYLASERALDLKANQVGALLAWLHGGGHLIVGLEQPSHLTGSGEWLRNVLPARPSGVSSLAAHGELQSWLASSRRFDGSDFDFARATGRRPATADTSDANPYLKVEADPKFEAAPLQVINCATHNGQVLAGTPDTPLVIIAPRGRGQITLLAFSPELEPFRSWKNAGMFWAKMIDLSPEVLGPGNYNRYGGRSVDGIIGAMIDSDQVRKLPVGWLMLLLVGYLVVIGPLDQYWLRKLNRQMLTWLTFPAYVVFFSLLIYFIGYKLRAGETEWTELHLLDVTPHGEVADLRGRSFGSIYSPVNARYAFGSEEPFATLRGEYSGPYGGGQETSRGTVEQRAAGFRATTAVPVWTSQLYLSDWWRQGPTPVKAEVTARQITVDNDLDTPLTHVRLVLGDEVYELGDVAAQEKKVFPRSAVSKVSLSSFVQLHSGNFQHAVNQRHQAFGDNASGRIGDWPNATVAASFIDLINTPNNYANFVSPPGFDLSRLARRGDAILFAWAANYSPTKPLNQFSARRAKKNTLLRVDLHE